MKVRLGEAGVFAASYLGSCFYFAWMNGAFFTSTLSAFSPAPAGPDAISVYWNVSVVGIFCGLIALVVAEGRFGQIAVNPHALLLCTAFVCLSTVFMLLGVSYPGPLTRALAGAGAFATGFFNAAYVIAWTQVYGSMKAEEAELAIPLAVALAQLFAIFLGGCQGWLAAFCIVAAPILTLLCLRVSFARLAAQDASSGSEKCNAGFETKEAASVLRAQPPLLDWRCGAFMAAVWLILSILTALTHLGERTSFADRYLVPFLVSFLVLLALLLLYIYFSRRLSLLEACRVLIPVMVISLASLLILPRESVSVAFLLTRTGAMFFWAIVWICCAHVVRNGCSTATHAGGVVRGWIQGGAALSIPTALLLDHVALGDVALGCIVLLVIVFAATLPSLMRVSSGLSVDCGDHESTHERSDGLERGASAYSFEERCELLAADFGLSPREREIMECLVRGRNLPYIRETLYISRNTINTHVKHIYAKMDIHSKQELIDRFEALGNRE